MRQTFNKRKKMFRNNEIIINYIKQTNLIKIKIKYFNF